VAVNWIRGGVATLLAGAAIVATQVVASSPAHAHDRSMGVLHPDYRYYAGYGGVSHNHWRVWAKDHVADGRGVMTYYRYRHPGNFIATSVVGDPDGSGPAIGEDWPPGQITAFQVCLQPYTDHYCTYWFPA
jgi:hypothetical protein